MKGFTGTLYVSDSRRTCIHRVVHPSPPWDSRKHTSSQKETPHPSAVIHHFPPPFSLRQPLIYFLSQWIDLFWTFHVNEVTQISTYHILKYWKILSQSSKLLGKMFLSSYLDKYTIMKKVRLQFRILRLPRILLLEMAAWREPALALSCKSTLAPWPLHPRCSCRQNA